MSMTLCSCDISTTKISSCCEPYATKCVAFERQGKYIAIVLHYNQKHKLYRFARDFLQTVRIWNFISLTKISRKQLLRVPLQTPLPKSYTKTKGLNGHFSLHIGKTNSTTNAVYFLKINHFRCWQERYGLAASCDTKPRANFPCRSS